MAGFFDSLKEAFRRTTRDDPGTGPSKTAFPPPAKKPAKGGSKISRGEYMLLLTTTAQAMTPGKTPTAMHISLAEASVKKQLAGRGVTVQGGTSHMDGIFDWVKRKVSDEKKLPEGHPALAAHQKAFRSDTAGDAEMSNLLAEMRRWHRAEHKGKADDRALARALRAWNHCERAKKTSASGIGSFWSRFKKVARHAGGIARKAAPIALPMLATSAVATPFLLRAISAAKQAERAKRAAQAAAPAPSPADGPVAETENQEETDAILDGCGSAEAEAMSRTKSPFYFPSFMTVGAEVPQPLMRAAIVAKAKRIARGGAPDARHMFLAEKIVKAGMSHQGHQMVIPGARPARRTV